MSAKNLDKYNRFRSRQVAFRLSLEEAALRIQLEDVLMQLQRITGSSDISPELMDTIRFISNIMNGMKEEPYV